MKYLILILTFLILPFYTQTTYGGDTAVSTGPEAQKIEIIVDSYSFEPDRIAVTEGRPVELMLRSVTSMIPHNFTIDDPSSGLDIDVDVPSGKDVTVTFTPVKTGEFKFYCDKKGIFGSHLKKGMEGTIVVLPASSESD
jgi:plastocyanin